jgi:hypothetical protein
MICRPGFIAKLGGRSGMAMKPGGVHLAFGFQNVVLSRAGAARSLRISSS